MDARARDELLADLDAVRVAGEQHSRAYFLATRVAFAARVDPPLLRRARLCFLPASDASAEADLWFHGVVKDLSPDGFVFHPEVAEELRRRFAAEDEAAYEETWRLVRESHADLAPVLRLEEELSYLAHSRSPDATERMRALLRSALVSMVCGNRDGLAPWAARALPRFPPKARALEEWSMLTVACELRLDRDRPPVEALRDDELVSWLAPARRASVGVRLRPGVLEVSAEAPATGGGAHGTTGTPWHVLEVPATDPLVLDVAPADEASAGDRARSFETVELRPGESRSIVARSSAVTLRTLLGEEYLLEPMEGALEREVLDFGGVFARHHAVLPADLEKELDAWLLADPSQPDRSGYVLVTGAAGTGKTALLTHVATRYAPSGSERAPHHFFRKEMPRWRDPLRARESLAAQMEGLLEARGIHRSGVATWLELLQTWSAHRGPGEQLVVVVEALDQAEGTEAGSIELMELLPARLPPGVVMVCSARDSTADLWLRGWVQPLATIEPPPPSEALLHRRLTGEMRARAGEDVWPMLADSIAILPAPWWAAALLQETGEYLVSQSSQLPPRVQGLDELVPRILRTRAEGLARAASLACAAREAIPDALLRHEVPDLDAVRREPNPIELLLERHENAGDVWWIPRSVAIREAFDEQAESSMVRRAHQTLADTYAAWPPSEAAVEVTEPAAAARERFALRHALYHAARAGLASKVEALSTDLDFLERRLRLDGPDRLVESLEEASLLSSPPVEA